MLPLSVLLRVTLIGKRDYEIQGESSIFSEVNAILGCRKQTTIAQEPMPCDLASCSRGRIAGVVLVVCLATISYGLGHFHAIYNHLTNRAGIQPFCATRDKHASGWSDLTDGECLQRFTAVQEAATAAVRNGSGTLLFKHVHKAGGTTLCQLAQRNMIAEGRHRVVHAVMSSNL